MTPDEKAQASARTMWPDDRASHGLEIALEEVGPGRARVSMIVTERMTNGHGIAHGGFIFLLADTAFAYACNSHGERAVAAQCSIAFLKPGRLGDRLVATAREIATAGRSGICDVSVTAGGAVIAEFRGHSRRIGGSLLGEAQP